MRFSIPAFTSLVAGCAIAMPALALPPVLERAPTDGAVTITIPKLSKLDKDLNSLLTVMGIGNGGMGIESVFQMVGIEKGIDLDGGVSITVFPPKDGKGEPEFLVIATTPSYKDLVGNFGVEPKDGGVDAISVGGADAFSKNIGDGFAAFSTTKARLDAFTGKPVNGAAVKKMIGVKGEALADSGDVAFVINSAVIRSQVEAGVKQRAEEMKNNPMLPPGMAELGPTAMKTLFDNTTSFVAGLDANGTGLALDFAVVCTPEGEYGKNLSQPGKSAELLSKLPMGRYLVAAAIDTSSPQLKNLFKTIFEMVPKEQMGDMADRIAEFRQQIDTVDGQAAIIGFPEAGMMAGILANTVNFTAAKAPAEVIAMNKSMAAAFTKSGKGTATYEEASVDVAGTKVDAYDVKFDPAKMEPAQSQAMGFLFGPGSMNGYVARVDGGIVKTFAKNSKLIGKAMKAAAGENPLGKDTLLSQVGAKLPKGRVAEIYVSPKGVLDTLKPMVGAFVPALGQTDVPESVPPMGLALTPGNNTLNASIYLPASLLKFIYETGNKVRDGMNGQDDGGQPAF